MKDNFPLIGWADESTFNIIEVRSMVIKSCEVLLKGDNIIARCPVFAGYTREDTANDDIRCDILTSLTECKTFESFKRYLEEITVPKLKKGRLVQVETLEKTFYSVKKFLDFYNSLDLQKPKEFKELL